MSPPRIAMPLRGITSPLGSFRRAQDARHAQYLQHSMSTSASARASVAAFSASNVVPFESQTVNATIHRFPSLEPVGFESFPAPYLYLPARRDILHRAVIYEGDKARAGTANTKWRDEVHGSRRKLRPQKGSGRARLGDKKSPMLTGGGVAFGPKPRDFSTDLPRKVYDLAWRTALSYRFRKGELVIVDNAMELEVPSARLLNSILGCWPDPLQKSLMVTLHERPFLSAALDRAGRIAGRTMTCDAVDVKDLLGQGRLIIEHTALKKIFRRHQADIADPIFGRIKPHSTGVLQPDWAGVEEYHKLVFASRAERNDMKPELYTNLGLKKVKSGREQEQTAEKVHVRAAELEEKAQEHLEAAKALMRKAERWKELNRPFAELEKNAALEEELAASLQARSAELREEFIDPVVQLIHDGLEMQRDAQLRLVERTQPYEHMMNGHDQAKQVEAQAKAKDLEAEVQDLLAKWEGDRGEVERLTIAAQELREEAELLRDDAANIRADAGE